MTLQAREIVLASLDQSQLPIQTSWRLNERHYGALQGLSRQETAPISYLDFDRLYFLDPTAFYSQQPYPWVNPEALLTAEGYSEPGHHPFLIRLQNDQTHIVGFVLIRDPTSTKSGVFDDAFSTTFAQRKMGAFLNSLPPLVFLPVFLHSGD